MPLPAFTAEASLYRSERNYQTAETRAGLSGGRAFLAQEELGLEDAAGDCLSACLEAGRGEEECMEQCSTAEAEEAV